MQPAFDNGFVRLYHGSAPDMAFLPDASVDCCITSPPYWGLRDYGLEPEVWDGVEGSEHQWGDWQESHDQREETTLGKSRTTERFYGEESRKFNGNHQKHTAGAFCALCGAWRGTLGLEPTPELYTQHLVQVFREVWRVLKPWGTVWLNLGDSYAGSWGDSGHRPERTGIPGHQRTKSTKGFTRNGHPRAPKPVTVSPPGLKPKDLVGIPWRAAFALQADGWWLRSDIIWAKPNPMPESVTDRPTKSHEYIFLLTKSEKYYYDQEAVREPQTGNTHSRGKKLVTPKAAPEDSNIRYKASWALSTAETIVPGGRNRRSVWTIATQPFPESHFAVFPEAIVERCVLAACPQVICTVCDKPRVRIVEHTAMEIDRSFNHPAELRTRTSGTMTKPPTGFTDCGHGSYQPGLVLDPFSGSGTTALVAQKLGRRAAGVDLSAEYTAMAAKRISEVPLPMPMEIA